LNLATLALLAVSALWGTTFVAVKSALSDCTPLLFVGVRFTVATIAALPLLRRPSDLRGAWRAGVPLGVALALGYSTQTLGLAVTTPARSAFVTGLNVAIVPLWAAVILGRKARPLSLLGLLVAVPGLWLLTSPAGSSWNSGDSWTAACALFFALHVVLVSRLGAAHDARVLLVSQLLVTATICLAAAPVLETPRATPSVRLALAIAVTAVLATVGTTWLQLRFQPRLDPTRAALVYVTEPVFAAVFAWLATGEALPPAGWAGGAVILAGMVLSELGSGGSGDPAGSPVPGPDGSPPGSPDARS
jgi:drug/metabolite transporter (DMT)-like permease